MQIRGVTGSDQDGILTLEQQQELDQRQKLTAKCFRDHWKKNGNRRPYPMGAMPTGYGKGRVVHLLMRGQEHHKILLIVGTKNILLDQSKEVLASLALEETGEASWSILPDISGVVILTTWQGLAAQIRAKRPIPKFNLIIVDEVHNIGTRSRLDLLRRLKGKKGGLTATAYRSSGEYRSPEEYGFTIVDSMTLPECIDKRWLSPLVGISLDTQVILPADVRQGEELNLAKLHKALRGSPDLFRNIASDVADRFLPSGMKTVIVVNRVNEEACEIATVLMKRGFKVGLAVNQAAARRLSGEFVTFDAIKRYKLPHDHPDAIQILISPQVISEGFDAPATECVIWTAPTMSALRYTQVMGRGSRRCVGKKYCLVVDYVYLIERYGYSYNFAQFFRKEEMQELPGGLMYVGPEDVGQTIEIPSQFTRGGKIVSVVKLQERIYPSAGDWLPLHQIGKMVEPRGQTWVESRIDCFAHLAEMRLGQNGHVCLHYPPSVLQALQDEVKEQPSAEDWLTAGQISAVLKKSGGWVREHLNKYCSGEGQMRQRKGKMTLHYPPSVLEKLRELSVCPSAEDWLNVLQLCKIVKRSSAWLKNRLEEHFPGVGEMRVTSSMNVYMHYPPEVLSKLFELAKGHQPADGWVTVKGIAKSVGKSATWVQSQLDQLDVHSEMRLDKGKRLFPYYPPDVLEKISLLAETWKRAEDWVPIHHIADQLGKSFSWVSSQISERFSDKGEMRIGKNNKLSMHYPPLILENLKQILSEVKPAGEWLTCPQISDTLGKSVAWVKARLKKSSFCRLRELRVGGSGNLDSHYPPSVVDELKKIIEKFPPAGDWLNACQISAIVNRDRRSYVRPLLEQYFMSQSEIRLNCKGMAVKHYPPSVVEEIKKYL